MKTTSILFAVFLLCLAVYPCSDLDTCVDEIRSGLAMSENVNHSHSSTEEYFCTPFCICSCCAAHIQLTHVVDVPFTSLIHNTLLDTLYREMPLLNNSDSIWQPPKIA